MTEYLEGLRAEQYCQYRRRSLFFALAWVGLAVVLGIIPLGRWIQFGTAISPLHTIQDKTIILFALLKRWVPWVALLCLAYHFAPDRARQRLQALLEAIAGWRWALPLILVFAFAIRLYWIYFFPTHPYADSVWYFRNAGELADGYGFVWDIQTGKPLAAWPIGYPAFLALIFLITGPNLLVAKLLNILISVVIVWLTYHLALQLLQRRSIAVMAALLLAGLPGFIVYCSLVSTDLLFMMLTTLGLVLALTRPQTRGLQAVMMGLVSGVLIGLTALVRATALALLPLWAVLRWFASTLSTRELRRGKIGLDKFCQIFLWLLLAAISMLVVLLPWTIRNYMYFHKLILVSTNGGQNFWIGSNPNAYGGYYFPRNESNPLSALIGQELEIDRKGYELGMQFIRENPRRALELLPAKLFYLYNSNDFGFHWNTLSAEKKNQTGSGPGAFAVANLIYVLIAGWAILGLAGLVCCERRNLLWLSGVIFAIYWTMLQLIYFGQDRFAMPLWPLLAIYAATGLDFFVQPASTPLSQEQPLPVS